MKKISFPHALPVIVIVPLAICVLLNAIIRPWLADHLGGEMIRSGNAVRGSDRWWVFDATITAGHPHLTAFLTLSDGAVAIGTFVAIAVLLLLAWLIER